MKAMDRYYSQGRADGVEEVFFNFEAGLTEIQHAVVVVDEGQCRDCFCPVGIFTADEGKGGANSYWEISVPEQDSFYLCVDCADDLRVANFGPAPYRTKPAKRAKKK